MTGATHCAFCSDHRVVMIAWGLVLHDKQGVTLCHVITVMHRNLDTQWCGPACMVARCKLPTRRKSVLHLKTGLPSAGCTSCYASCSTHFSARSHHRLSTSDIESSRLRLEPYTDSELTARPHAGRPISI